MQSAIIGIGNQVAGGNAIITETVNDEFRKGAQNADYMFIPNWLLIEKGKQFAAGYPTMLGTTSNN